MLLGIHLTSIQEKHALVLLYMLLDFSPIVIWMDSSFYVCPSSRFIVNLNLIGIMAFTF